MRYLFFLILLAPLLLPAQMINGEPLVTTYSIVARDPATGEMGVAVQSHWFSVGSIVSWAEAGVGAVATQSLVNPAFGQQGLQLLKAGLSAQDALAELIRKDEGRDVRQVAIVDNLGNVAVHTGSKCIEYAGHETGPGFSVQANLMRNAGVWPEMAKKFKETKGPLAERMLAALKAGEGAGGDIRGKQSIAVLVVAGSATGNLWEDRLIDLRIEDHPEPLTEMERLLKLFRAYEHMNKGDVALEENDAQRALFEYSAAQQLVPGHVEMKYWYAVSLTNMDKLSEALPLFKDVFISDTSWIVLTPRLTKNGLLNVSDTELQQILDLNPLK